MRIVKLCAVLLLFVAVFSYSENIRGPIVKIIDTEALNNNRVTEFDISPEELFAFSPDFNHLPDKISLEIRSSDKIKQFRDSFSIYSYNRVSPMPDIDKKSYTGKYFKSYLIPDRTRFFVDIIFNKDYLNDNRLKGTEVLDFTGEIDSPIMMTILPVMKGVPDYLFLEKFRIKISTEWPESGKLELKVFADSKNKEIFEYDLFIDGKKLEYEPKFILNTGIHNISINKKGFIAYKEDVTIKTNEKRVHEIVLKRNNPEITIFSPDESVLYIDGNIQNTKKIKNLFPGEHTILFKLGEYSLSRKISLEEGKKYVVNLLLDIEINEE
jgi:hypothetical protein